LGQKRGEKLKRSKKETCGEICWGKGRRPESDGFKHSQEGKPEKKPLKREKKRSGLNEYRGETKRTPNLGVTK